MIASVTYNTSGSAGPYTITFPFIEESDVEVYLDGVANTAFTIAGTALTLNTAPSAVAIEIRRNTQDALYVDFSAPAPISPEDLDTATQQAIYIAQEAKDTVSTFDAVTLQLDASGVYWDAETKRIKNIVDPSAAQDAATKTYVDTADAILSAAIAAAQIEAGNVPTPANPGDNGKVLQAGSGTYAWTTSTLAALSDITALGLRIGKATSQGELLSIIGAAAARAYAERGHVHPYTDLVGTAPAAFSPIANQVFGG